MTTTTPPARPTATERAGDWSRRLRTALILLAGVSLLTGLNAGLLRLGVWAPLSSTRLGDLHGPVMVLGFMGSLIALERAQALRNSLAYLAPALLAAGSLTLIAGGPLLLGKLLLLDGALAFTAVAIALWRRAPLGLVAAQAVGTAFAALAAGLWLVTDLAVILPLLAAFLVIMIASERAELAQLTMGRRAVPALLAASVAVSVSAMTTLIAPDWGARALGLSCLVVAVWLIRDDVGRRMIRATGLRRFNAAALLLGNVWLGVAGVVWAVGGQPSASGAYDAVIHGVFLGFGMSMIMAHAPIIFPTVLGRPLPYRPAMWAPLALLHLGMAIRLAGGLGAVAPLYRLGGVLTVLSVLAFAITVIYSVVKR